MYTQVLWTAIGMCLLIVQVLLGNVTLSISCGRVNIYICALYIVRVMVYMFILETCLWNAKLMTTLQFDVYGTSNIVYHIIH